MKIHKSLVQPKPPLTSARLRTRDESLILLFSILTVVLLLAIGVFFFVQRGWDDSPYDLHCGLSAAVVTVAGTLTIVILIVIFTTYVTPRLNQFRHGEYLVRWQYSEDELIAYSEHRLKLANKWLYIGLALALVVWLIDASIAFSSVPAPPPGKYALRSLVFIVGGLVLGATWLAIARLRAYRCRYGVGEAIIGPISAYWHGLFFVFDLSSPTTQPRIESLHQQSFLVLVSSNATRHGKTYHQHFIPIPEDRMQEAQQVLAIVRSSLDVRKKIADQLRQTPIQNPVS